MVIWPQGIFLALLFQLLLTIPTSYNVSWPKNCFSTQDFLRDHPSSFSFFHTLASFSVITFVILWLLRLPNVFSLILFFSSFRNIQFFLSNTHVRMCHLCTFVAFDFGLGQTDCYKIFFIQIDKLNCISQKQIFSLTHISFSQLNAKCNKD